MDEETKAIVDDMRYVLSTPAGRRVMRRLTERCGMMRSPYDTAEADVNNALYRMGERNIGLFIFEQISAATEPAELGNFLKGRI